jgi:tetratricopeptide (TPR) repeat protein
LGFSLGKLGHYTEAIEKYQAAIKLDPNDNESLGSLGWYFYFGLKDFPKSIELSRKALEIDGKVVAIRFNLAIALLHDGQFEDAKEEYQNTIQMIKTDDYSDTEYVKNKKELLQKQALDDLYDAQKRLRGNYCHRSRK